MLHIKKLFGEVIFAPQVVRRVQRKGNKELAFMPHDSTDALVKKALNQASECCELCSEPIVESDKVKVLELQSQSRKRCGPVWLIHERCYTVFNRTINLSNLYHFVQRDRTREPRRSDQLFYTRPARDYSERAQSLSE